MEKPSTSATCPAKRWHDVAYWALIAVACVVFLVMNLLTTLKEDDLAYSLIEGAWTPIHSVGDWLQSYAYHYTHSNGRFADLVAMLFGGLLGKMAFNVCNTLVFGVLLHLLSLLITGRRSIMVVAMFLAVTGTCYPVPGETMLWMAGACNYLWAITASLLLVVCLCRTTGKVGWGKGVLMFLGAFVAGAFNEATSFGFLLGMVLYYVFNRKRFNRAAALALTGYALGVLLLVASPGAWARAAQGDLVFNLPWTDLLYSRWSIFSEKMWRFYLPVLVLVVGVAVLLLKRGGAIKRSVWSYVFLALTLVMLVLGVNQERAYAPLVTVAFILLAMVADRLLQRWPWVRVALIVVSLALAAFTFGRGVKMLREYKVFDEAVMSEIVDAPDQAVLRERQFEGYSRFIKPMNFSSTRFFAHEIIYRAYFGKKNVQFVSDSVYVRYHEGRLLDGADAQVPECDHPELAGPVYTFPDQDYAAVLIKTPYIPSTFQLARYYRVSICGESIDPDEMARRRHYGISTEYDPHGFYPLVYQGQCYLITDPSDAFDVRMVFPLTLPPDVLEITLSR